MSRRPKNAIKLGPRAWVKTSDLDWNFSRGGGPGGQSVNNTASQVELRVSLHAIRGLNKNQQRKLRSLAGHRRTKDDELIITSHTHRRQIDNRRACRKRLRDLVKKASKKQKKRKKTRPSRAQKRKRLREKRKHAEKKKRRRWRPPPGSY